MYIKGVRNIDLKTKFKKHFWKMVVSALVIILAVFMGVTGLTNQASLHSEAEKGKVRYEADKTDKRTDIVKIEVVLDANGPYWNKLKPITITDDKMIYDIMIEDSKPLTDESRINDMSGVGRKNNKLIATGTDGSKREIKFAYDYLYEVGYIEVDGTKAEPDYNFFRYVSDLNEYANPDADIEKQVLRLFEKFDWTVDYKINTVQEKLPANLKHKAGEYPTKIYWAYNKELSRQIGFDFTGNLGKDVVVEIYRLRESLPEFMKPRRDARGVILKYNNQIVGAYVDAGRHNSFACSLDRKSLKDITGKEWDGWIADYIDYEDELEIKLSKMEPEDIIREYFKALDKHDIKMVWALLTRKSLTQQLSSNLNNQYLFNKDAGKTDYNIKSAKLLEVKEFKGIQNEPGVLEYQVKVDFDFKKMITADDGIWPRFVIMKKESEKSGWRIDGVGTGP